MEGAASESAFPSGKKAVPGYIKPYKRMAYGGTPEWAGDRPNYFLPGQCSYTLASRFLKNSKYDSTAVVDEDDDHSATSTNNSITGMLEKFHASRKLKAGDRFCTGLSLEYSPTYQVNKWNNPETGISYSVTPSRTYQRDGETCREFHVIGVKGNDASEVHGTACRNKQGGWTVVKQDSSF